MTQRIGGGQTERDKGWKPLSRDDPDTSCSGRKKRFGAWIRHRLEACFTLLLVVVLLAVGAQSTRAQVGNDYAVSPAFVLDTRDASVNSAAAVTSSTFILDTRDANGSSVGVSGTFTLDTRALDGQKGTGVSGVFPLDTRGSLPVGVGFQQTGAGFGARTVGSITDKTFTITNNSSTTIFGTISLSGSFSVVGDNTYNLAPGQSRDITTRFSPSAPGTYTGNVTLSGGGGYTGQITASAYADPTATTGAISGCVTAAGSNTPISGAEVMALGPGNWLADLWAGVWNTGPKVKTDCNGSYSITGLQPGAGYMIIATVDSQQFKGKKIANMSVAAGQMTTCNIALDPLSPSTTSTPVVLVQGLGADKEWIAGGSDYWKKLTETLQSNNITVWDCNNPEDGTLLNSTSQSGHFINGEKSIQYNANNLTLYIQQKAIQYWKTNLSYPTQINIVAHSMGGLITRLALNGGDKFLCSNPINGDLFTVKVNMVVMLATPNAGSEVADYFAPKGFSLLKNCDWSPLFQPSWESTQDLTGQHIRYNFIKTWSSNVPLYIYAGTKGLISDDWSLQFSAAIIANTNSGNPIDAINNDGAVALSSVRGIYYISMTLFGFISGVYSVDSSFDAIPTEEAIDTDSQFGSSHVVDHLSMLNDTKTLNWVVSKLAGTCSPQTTLAGNQVQALGLGELATTPTQSALSVNQAFGAVQSGSESEAASTPMQQIAQTNSVLGSGSSATVQVISDASTALKFQLMCSGTDVAFRLTDPLGNTVDSTTPQTNATVQYSAVVSGSSSILSYQITNPTAGAWTVTLDGSNMVEPQVGFNLTVFGDSNIAMIPITGPLFGQGQDVIVTCALGDLSATPATPILNASITATVLLPDGTTTTLSLVDDGLHNDGAPNDGIYAAVFSGVFQTGDYLITYQATGQNSQGQTLQRTTTGAFSVSTGNGSILGDPIYSTINTTGTGLADCLQVACWVNPSVSGTYILSGQLVDTTGSSRFGQSASFSSNGAGATTLNLLFDLNQIRASIGAGQVHIENLQLLEVNSTTTAWLDSYQGTSTFQIGPNVIIPPQSQTPEEGTSTTISVTADSGTGDTYQWQFNGVAIAGATNATLSIPLVTWPQAGAYSVVVTNETGSVTTQSGTLTINPATTFAHWQQARFTASQLSDATVSGVAADPVNSGIVNLLRYAFNANPFTTDRSILPTSAVELDSGDGKKYPTFTYKKRISSTDLSYVVEVSDDLATWDTSGTQIEQIGTPSATGDGVTQQVKVRVKTPLESLKNKFIRLRVIKN